MNKQNKGIKLVPVSVNGVTLQINPSSIGKEKRTVHHGEFKGVKVHSPESCKVGDSVVVWPEAGKPLAMVLSKAEMGVIATQFLESEGYQVSEPFNKHA